MEVLSHVVAVGAVSVEREVTWEEIARLHGRDEVVLNCADADVEQRMKAEVEKAIEARDTVGGVFEVRAHHVPPGLGTYAQWDERLDGLLAQAVMSLQAVKAVEIGSGITAAGAPGSSVHDEIGYDDTHRRWGANSPALPASRTAPAAWKAACRTGRTSWCAAI